MADNPYFAGRGEILSWINSTLSLKLTKVEETSNGAIACQLMDALHPGTVAMKKVDFNAKNEYDMINNYKVLQDSFNKNNIEKPVPVNNLVKGRPLDNMEFMQWFKSYWDQATGGQGIDDYDGPGRRQMCKTGDLKGQSAVPAKAATRTAAPPQMQRVPSARAASTTAKPAASSSISSKEVSEITDQMNEFRIKADNFEKEKDFYYSKLRMIEVMCQTPVIVDIPIMKKVEELLYAATPEEGREVLHSAQLEFAGQVYDDVDVMGDA